MHDRRVIRHITFKPVKHCRPPCLRTCLYRPPFRHFPSPPRYNTLSSSTRTFTSSAAACRETQVLASPSSKPAFHFAHKYFDTFSIATTRLITCCAALVLTTTRHTNYFPPQNHLWSNRPDPSGCFFSTSFSGIHIRSMSPRVSRAHNTSETCPASVCASTKPRLNAQIFPPPIRPPLQYPRLPTRHPQLCVATFAETSPSTPSLHLTQPPKHPPQSPWRTSAPPKDVWFA